jgi:hypothetical protein
LVRPPDGDTSVSRSLTAFIPSSLTDRGRIVEELTDRGQVRREDLPAPGYRKVRVALRFQTSGDLHADLGEVSFIDVGGLRVLVETTSRLAAERRFVVDALRPHTLRIIDLCGWTDLLVTGLNHASPGGRAVGHSSDVP